MTAFSPREAHHPFIESRLSRVADIALDFLYTPDQRPERPRPARQGAIRRGLAAVGRAIREYIRRQRVVSELSRLSDRELADIGLNRGEIGQVFSRDFVARHTAEQGG